jgi:3-deoxy-D-manno-octulosonate 8-phosphate phosphatase (KDO 8-P phosphatase)
MLISNISRTEAKKIKLLVLDVDGTLTDGKLYIGNEGEVFKAFNVKDGCGIHDILPKNGIKVAIITARESNIVLNRCNELNIDYIFQGVRNKLDKLCELADSLGYCSNEFGRYAEIAYMGDDILDIPVMNICGIRACPKNASKEVLECVNFTSDYFGGDGAVRELIDWICLEVV